MKFYIAIVIKVNVYSPKMKYKTRSKRLSKKNVCKYYTSSLSLCYV